MITLIKTWGNTERPGYFEVRADYLDDSGSIINEVLTFEKEPEKQAITDAADERRTKLQAIADSKQSAESDYLNEQEKQAWAMVETKVVEMLKTVKTVSEITTTLSSLTTAKATDTAETAEVKAG